MKRRVIIVMLAAIMGSGMCGCDINVSVNDDNGNETVTQSDDTDDEEDEIDQQINPNFLKNSPFRGE